MHLVRKLQQHIVDRRTLAALALPLIEVGFERHFVEQGHRAEACAFEVEVEVHVVLLGVLLSLTIFGLILRWLCFTAYFVVRSATWFANRLPDFFRDGNLELWLLESTVDNFGCGTT